MTNSYSYYGVLLILYAKFKQCQGGLLYNMEKTRCVNTTFHLDDTPLHNVFNMLYYIEDEETKGEDYKAIRKFCKVALRHFRPETIAPSGHFDYDDFEHRIYFKSDFSQEEFLIDRESTCRFHRVAIWYKGEKYYLRVRATSEDNVIYHCYMTWPTKEVMPQPFIGIGRELFILNKAFKVDQNRKGYFILKFEGSEPSDGTYSLADIAIFNPVNKNSLRIQYFQDPVQMYNLDEFIPIRSSEDRDHLMYKFKKLVKKTKRRREEEEKARKVEKEQKEKVKREMHKIREEERELRRQELLQKEKQKSKKNESKEERTIKLQKDAQSDTQVHERALTEKEHISKGKQPMGGKETHRRKIQEPEEGEENRETLLEETNRLEILELNNNSRIKEQSLQPEQKPDKQKEVEKGRKGRKSRHRGDKSN